MCEKQPGLRCAADTCENAQQAALAYEHARPEGPAVNPLPPADIAALPAPTAEDLRDSVRDFRDPSTTDAERQGIQEWWTQNGIPNQFAAMCEASRISTSHSQRTFANGVEQWHNDAGELHRTDGPAVTRADGTKEWHVNGVNVSPRPEETFVYSNGERAEEQTPDVLLEPKNGWTSTFNPVERTFDVRTPYSDTPRRYAASRPSAAVRASDLASSAEAATLADAGVPVGMWSQVADSPARPKLAAELLALPNAEARQQHLARYLEWQNLSSTGQINTWRAREVAHAAAYQFEAARQYRQGLSRRLAGSSLDEKQATQVENAVRDEMRSAHRYLAAVDDLRALSGKTPRYPDTAARVKNGHYRGQLAPYDTSTEVAWDDVDALIAKPAASLAQSRN